MTAVLAALLTVAVAGWLLERERSQVVRSAASERTELLDRFDREREQWATERAELLNRIKPETAQYIHTDEFVVPPAVPMDDDPAFWESKEAMAERLAAAEMAGEVA